MCSALALNTRQGFWSNCHLKKSDNVAFSNTFLFTIATNNSCEIKQIQSKKKTKPKTTTTTTKQKKQSVVKSTINHQG